MSRPAWSPEGRHLLLDQLLRRGKNRLSVSGAVVVVLHGSTAGSSPAMTSQVLYRSDRHFDWAGTLAWYPEGIRIAVRTRDSIAEISAEEGRVLARHPHNRGNSGWLNWLRGTVESDAAAINDHETMREEP
jgi:hypothetical protein